MINFPIKLNEEKKAESSKSKGRKPGKHLKCRYMGIL